MSLRLREFRERVLSGSGISFGNSETAARQGQTFRLRARPQSTRAEPPHNRISLLCPIATRDVFATNSHRSGKRRGSQRFRSYPSLKEVVAFRREKRAKHAGFVRDVS